jgi:hypothetical protein
MSDVKADRMSKELYQNPNFNIEKIISDLQLLKSETDSIFNAPPPKPKEEEKPKEDEKMENTEEKKEGEDNKGEDSEMKAEGETPPPMEEQPKE